MPPFLRPTNIKNETIDITNIPDIMKAEYILFAFIINMKR